MHSSHEACQITYYMELAGDLPREWHAADAGITRTVYSEWGAIRVIKPVGEYMMGCQPLDPTTSVRQGIASGLVRGGSLDKRRPTSAQVCLGVAFLLTAGLVIGYLCLPEALAPSDFERQLRIAAGSNFSDVEMPSSQSRDLLSDITKRYGKVEAVMSSRCLINPKWSYPTLQGRVVVRRRNKTSIEDYTFLVGAESRLVLLGVAKQ